jgi:F-BAR domain only protein
MSAQDQHPAQNASESPSGNTGEQRVVYSSSILFEKQPVEAMEALVIRRQQAKQINKELAEWFTAYGRLRLHYVDELKKIHKRGLSCLPTRTPPYKLLS